MSRNGIEKDVQWHDRINNKLFIYNLSRFKICISVSIFLNLNYIMIILYSNTTITITDLRI